MRQTRHVLAVALVATALCADRAVAAAPSVSPQIAGVAGRLVSRLSVTFRRVVPGVKIDLRREDRFASEGVACVWVDTETRGFRRGLSRCEFRLPPPVC